MKYYFSLLLVVLFIGCQKDNDVLEYQEDEEITDMVTNTIAYFDLEPDIVLPINAKNLDTALKHYDDTLLTCFFLRFSYYGNVYIVKTIDIALSDGGLTVPPVTDHSELSMMPSVCPIEKDSMINDWEEWYDYTFVLVHDEIYSYPSFYFFNYDYYDSRNRYYGMRINRNLKDYYGWFYMDISKDSIRIFEYAYNTIENGEINAGQKNNEK